MPVVKLYANLRKLAGSKELSVSGETLQAALDDLIRQHPPLQDALLVNRELHPQVIVTVNGQNFIRPDAPVQPQDTIAIFPPLAGG